MSQLTPTPSLERKGFSILRALRSAAALPLVLALLAACSGAGAPAPAASTVAPPAAASEAPLPGPSFPTTVSDDEGTSVALARAAERVVSLSPSNTETVFTLGKGETLLAGSAFDDYPPEAKDLPDVATFDQGVLVERVVDLRPDLVLAAGNNFTPRKDIERLRQLGIPVLVLYAENVDEVLADIRLIGLVIGAADEAKRLTDTMKLRLDAIASAASAAGSRPRVFYELGDQPEIYGPADGSFVADLVTLAGGDPITTGSTMSFSIPLERLATADPEVIVLGDANYGVTPDAVRKRPGAWRQMTAVREGQIRAVDDIIVTRPGPRLADGLAELARAIHPDLAIPASPSPAASG